MGTPFVKIADIADGAWKNFGFSNNESPIEEKMTGALQRFGVKIEFQKEIGPYRADIYVPSDKIVVECDGIEYHQDKERDKKRDKYMRENGYKVLRFWGTEIHNDALYCAEIVINNMKNQPEKFLKFAEEREYADLLDTKCQLCFKVVDSDVCQECSELYL